MDDTYLGTLIQEPYELVIPSEMLQNGEKHLKIAVSNLMANRIAYLDKQGYTWQKFYNINMSARRAENRGENGYFSAEKWSPKASGLAGQVRLIPLHKKEN